MHQRSSKPQQAGNISHYCHRVLNGEELEQGENIHFEVNPKTGTHTLVIKDAAPGMQGEIKAVAKNNGGEVLCAATLEVRGRAPTFMEPPIKCTVLEGGYLLMCVTVFPADVVWFDISGSLF